MIGIPCSSATRSARGLGFFGVFGVGPAFFAADHAVQIDDGFRPVHLLRVTGNVPSGPQETELLAREAEETNRPARPGALKESGQIEQCPAPRRIVRRMRAHP